MPTIAASAQPEFTYLDTSVLMALLCHEPESARVDAWFAQLRTTLVSTPWLRTELSSAVALKVRSKQMKAADVQMVIAAGRHMLLTTKSEALKAEDFEAAASLCAESRHPLRAPDALHLSAAQRLACSHIATLDQVMGQAALDLGIQPIDFLS